MGAPIVMQPELHPDAISPRAGFWPDPTKEAFRRLQEPSKRRNSAGIIFCYEEGNFYFTETNTIPLHNRFNCLSDGISDNISDSDFVPDFVSNYVDNNNGNKFTDFTNNYHF